MDDISGIFLFISAFSFCLRIFSPFLSDLKSIAKLTEPLGGEITVTCETDMTGNIPKTAMEKALADQLKNSKFARPVEKSQRKGCYYTSIPRVIKHKGLSGQELTNLNVDKVRFS